MFPTYEGRTKTGETTKVIDKGHLMALDDPDVRALAAKLGVVKSLKEVWIPGVPGINAKGSYEHYAADPTRWIRREAKEHPTLVR
jgi:hypothetical protein